jgi:hypothetical protein
MTKTVVNIILLSILNTFAVAGIMLFYGLLIYWHKQGIVHFDPFKGLVVYIVVLFLLNILLFYFNELHNYKWPIKKKILALISILVLLYPGIIILNSIFQNIVGGISFIVQIAR